MENFEKTLNEILVRNSINLEDGLNYIGEGGYSAFISYAEVVEKIKTWDNEQKQKFIDTSIRLEKQCKNIKSYLDFIANSLM